MIRVRIERNLVVSVEPVADAAAGDAPESRLAIGSQLATNFQRNGCIDDDYLFREVEQARSFAVLALDFVKRLTERHAARLETWDFEHDSGWSSGDPVLNSNPGATPGNT